jgi:Flp pilus assembly pilin Flp
MIMMDKPRLNLRAETGQGLVEYAMIILLVALVIVGTLGLFGTQLSGLYATFSGSF